MGEDARWVIGSCPLCLPPSLILVLLLPSLRLWRLEESYLWGVSGGLGARDL